MYVYKCVRKLGFVCRKDKLFYCKTCKRLPKTTNIAEGWKNDQNNRFGTLQSSLRVFLDWLQKYQFEVQCRRMKLTAGRPALQ